LGSDSIPRHAHIRGRIAAKENQEKVGNTTKSDDVKKPQWIEVVEKSEHSKEVVQMKWGKVARSPKTKTCIIDKNRTSEGMTFLINQR